MSTELYYGSKIDSFHYLPIAIQLYFIFTLDLFIC